MRSRACPERSRGPAPSEVEGTSGVAYSADSAPHCVASAEQRVDFGYEGWMAAWAVGHRYVSGVRKTTPTVQAALICGPQKAEAAQPGHRQTVRTEEQLT